MTKYVGVRLSWFWHQQDLKNVIKTKILSPLKWLLIWSKLGWGKLSQVGDFLWIWQFWILIHPKSFLYRAHFRWAFLFSWTHTWFNMSATEIRQSLSFDPPKNQFWKTAEFAAMLEACLNIRFSSQFDIKQVRSWIPSRDRTERSYVSILFEWEVLIGQFQFECLACSKILVWTYSRGLLLCLTGHLGWLKWTPFTISLREG